MSFGEQKAPNEVAANRFVGPQGLLCTAVWEMHPVITAAKLKTYTVKDLAVMARKKRIAGWHSMRKEELIRALIKHAKAQAAARSKSAAGKKAGKATEGNGKQGRKKRLSPYAQRRLKQIKTKLASSKDLAFRSVGGGNGDRQDRLVVMVRDPFWLHAYWELTRRSVDRARAAMGQYWHGAQPTLRVNEVTRNGTTSAAIRVVRDIAVHGGVNNWYVDVQNPPRSFQLEIGYLWNSEQFFCLARSNVVSTPRVDAGDAFDRNWAEVAKDFDRVYAMSAGYLEEDGNSELRDVLEQQLQRPVGDALANQFGPGAAATSSERDFPFEVGTELIVHGVTAPDAQVTLRGEPVRLRPDGSFAVRFTLPDRRHVLPVVASSPDGVEQRTIVLAVDRNTKVMEPIIRDPSD